MKYIPATLGLALVGLLDEHSHTSNEREYLAASGYRGSKLCCDVPAITDKHVVTASGIAPADLARESFKILDLFRAEAFDAWYTLSSGATHQGITA